MNTETRDETEAAIDIRHLTDIQFAQLGAGQLAYIKPIRIQGRQVYAIHAANGAPMALAEDRETAQGAIEDHEMAPASVH